MQRCLSVGLCSVVMGSGPGVVYLRYVAFDSILTSGVSTRVPKMDEETYTIFQAA